MSRFGGIPVDGQGQQTKPSGSRFGGVPVDGAGGPEKPYEPFPEYASAPSWGDTASMLGKRFVREVAAVPGYAADMIDAVGAIPGVNATPLGTITGARKAQLGLMGYDPSQGGPAPLGSDNIREAIGGYAPSLKPRDPKTDFERYAGAVVDFAAPAAVSLGAGIVPATARTLALEGGATLTGGIGQEIGRDAAPGNPWAPAIGGLAGTILNPATLARVPGQVVRGAIRGGEKGRQAVNQAVKAFKEFGSSPTVGQAAPESGVGRVIESVLARSPGGAHVMLDKFRSQIEKAGKYVNDMTTKTAGVNITYHDAGQTVAQGARQFRGRFDKIRTALEDQFNKMVPRSSRFQAPEYQKALGDLTGVAEGFPNTQRTVQNAFVRQLAEDFSKDAKGGTISLEALRGIRTRVGMELDQAVLKPDVDTGAMKHLYSALTRDIETIANQAGPRARMAWDRAMMVERDGNLRLEKIIDPLVKNRTVEQIQKSISQLDGTRARGLMKSLTPEQRRIVAASVMEDMGRATPSQQVNNADAVAAPEFSFETFLTNYRKMKQAGMADAVFNAPETAGMREGLDALLTASGRARESARFLGNPSGTARAGMAQAAMYSMVTAPFDPSLMTAAASFTGFYLAPNLGARLFRNPKFVSWLGKATRISPAEMPGHIARLGKIASEYPDSAGPIREYVNAIQAQIGTPQQETPQ